MTRLVNNFVATVAFLGMIAIPGEVWAVQPAPDNAAAAQHRAAKRRHRRAVRKTVKRVGIGAAGGAAAGAVIGGGPGAAVGAIAGAGAGAIYDQHEKDKGR